jgi:RNA polymerase-binding transcription factor DksA
MEQPDLDAAERDVDAVEKALNRLDDGTYETCEVCGAPIADELLADDPTRRACAEHG